MPPVPPRTALEFNRRGNRLMISCGPCGYTHFVDPESIVLTFGEDFDLIAGAAEVSAQLYCPACGEGRPDVFTWQPADEHPGAAAAPRDGAWPDLLRHVVGGRR